MLSSADRTVDIRFIMTEGRPIRSRCETYSAGMTPVTLYTMVEERLMAAFPAGTFVVVLDAESVHVVHFKFILEMGLNLDIFFGLSDGRCDSLLLRGRGRRESSA